MNFQSKSSFEKHLNKYATLVLTVVTVILTVLNNFEKVSHEVVFLAFMFVNVTSTNINENNTANISGTIHGIAKKKFLPEVIAYKSKDEFFKALINTLEVTVNEVKLTAIRDNAPQKFRSPKWYQAVLEWSEKSGRQVRKTISLSFQTRRIPPLFLMKPHRYHC